MSLPVSVGDSDAQNRDPNPIATSSSSDLSSGPSFSSVGPINISMSSTLALNDKHNLGRSGSNQIGSHINADLGGSGNKAEVTSLCPSGIPSCNGECCEAGKICINGRCVTPHQQCPHDTTPCGNECCRADKVCVNGHCVTPHQQCPHDTTPCGSECCRAGEDCQNGHCITTNPHDHDHHGGINQPGEMVFVNSAYPIFANINLPIWQVAPPQLRLGIIAGSGMSAQQTNYVQIGTGNTINLLVHSPNGGITDIYDLVKSSNEVSGYFPAPNIPELQATTQHPTDMAGYNNGLSAYASTINLPAGDSIGQYPITVAGRHFIFLNSGNDASNIVILDAT